MMRIGRKQTQWGGGGGGEGFEFHCSCSPAHMVYTVYLCEFYLHAPIIV